MAYYPIVNRNQQATTLLDQRNLPDFYMEDFSVLGLCVNDCNRAAAILEQHQFTVSQSNGAVAVAVNEAAQVAKAVGLLKENGLACEVADVAEGIYQG